MANDELKSSELDGVQEVDFSRAAIRAIYGSGAIAEERWNRANTDIRFEDVVNELTGKVGRAISCPFHGTDSRPSFYIYSGNNDGYCFGCPPREGYYDNIRFVSKFLTFSRIKALKWLEKKWDLPAIADVILEQEDEDEEEQIVTLHFADLNEHYIQFAARDIQEAQDPEYAEQFLRIYFEAAKDENVVPLGRVLGKERVQKILQRKAR